MDVQDQLTKVILFCTSFSEEDQATPRWEPVEQAYASQAGQAYVNGCICTQCKLESMPALEMELRAVSALVPHRTHVSASPRRRKRPSPDEVVSQSGVVLRQRSTARFYAAFFATRFHVTLISEL